MIGPDNEINNNGEVGDVNISPSWKLQKGS